jgi:hypothetical protein
MSQSQSQKGLIYACAIFNQAQQKKTHAGEHYCM